MNQLDSKAVWLFFFSTVSRMFLPLISLIVITNIYPVLWGLSTESIDPSRIETDTFFGFIKWLWLIIPASLILSFVWAKLSYNFYRYELTEAGFRKELGVIYKKYVTIPYDRIQNVDIYRGLLARILGLSDLNIQTAGASAIVGRYGSASIGSEGRLPGLSREIAEKLRDELIQRARYSKSQGI